jgi:hypothetical protein
MKQVRQPVEPAELGLVIRDPGQGAAGKARPRLGQRHQGHQPTRQEVQLGLELPAGQAPLEVPVDGLLLSLAQLVAGKQSLGLSAPHGSIPFL